MVCHAMNHVKTGLRLYSGLSVDHRCVRALMKYARVLLMSITALLGPTICPGSERAGCPSGVITDVRAALRGVNPPGVMRLASPREDRGDPSYAEAGGRYASSWANKAQITRALLLAKATAATWVPVRCVRAHSHRPCVSVRRSARCTTARAP